MNPQHPEELDWVKIRFECTVNQVFEKLHLEVKSDVERINSLQPTREFKIQRFGDYFSVFQEGVLVGPRAVTFKREQMSIEVTTHIRSNNSKDPVIATIVVNDFGKCCLRVDDKERSFWQFRKDTLEPLFFG